MAATTSLSDCHALAVSVSSAGGSIPAPLQHLLAAADLLMAPGATQAPIRPIVDAALRGELDEKKLDKLVADAAHQVAIANYRKDLRQIAADFGQTRSRGGNSMRANAKIVFNPMAKYRGQKLVQPAPRACILQEPRGNLANVAGMPKVLAHELFDRQQALGSLIAKGRGQTNLLGTI